MRRGLIITFWAAALFAGYLVWSALRPVLLAPKQPSNTAPAVSAPKIPGPVVSRPILIVPATAVERKLPIKVAPSNPVIDTAKIPVTGNGGVTVTFLNISTGRATTQFIPAPAPWFALEANNELNAGIEFGDKGRRVPVEYRRDILRIKNIHLIGTGGVKIPAETGANFEWSVGARAAWRF